MHIVQNPVNKYNRARSICNYVSSLTSVPVPEAMSPDPMWPVCCVEKTCSVRGEAMCVQRRLQISPEKFEITLKFCGAPIILRSILLLVCKTQD